jgi:hypothetical protein
MSKIRTSVKGREIDMERLITKHETTPAVGNLKVNARGDELGVGGQVIKTREQVIQDYYRNQQPSSASFNQRATADVTAAPVEAAEPAKKSSKKNTVQAKTRDSDVDRGEDE